jgi:Cys-rich protein (TIGR01571 family)
MTRERLNWLGSPGSVAEVAATFKRVVLAFIGYIVVSQCLSVIYMGLIGDPVTDDGIYDKSDVPASALVVDAIAQTLKLVFALYILVATIRTRAYIRDKYAIPEQSCRGCEDCCCSFWCGCCTIMQMMRHTADYDKYDAVCCTETGLPPQGVMNNPNV